MTDLLMSFLSSQQRGHMTPLKTIKNDIKMKKITNYKDKIKNEIPI